ncbi:MAG: hypothetical protein V2I27_05050 [Erythrobacter sp.]|jgi:hypothetical protein|nr:hypothetical protein [Erythrobacter sp.]
MRVRFTKLKDGWQEVAVLREGACPSPFRFPPKGPVPHDATHLFVESVFGLQRGFWGRVAAGQDPQAVEEEAKAGGHASAKRAQVPAPGLVELLQAERLVECFEAELWSGSSDDAGLSAMARAGWEASHVPPLELDATRLAAVRQRMSAFAHEWAQLAIGGMIACEWSGKDMR